MRRQTLAGAVAIGLLWSIATAGVAAGHDPDLAAADETGEPALLVGGDFAGDTRLLVLGASGQVVAEGAGDGMIANASACPGDATFLEHVRREDAGPTLAIRDLSTLDVVREIDLADVLPPDAGVVDVLCRDESGAAPVILGDLGTGIVELGPTKRVIAEGAWRLGALADDAAIVVPEKGSNEVHLVSLADGSDRLLSQRPGGPGVPWDVHSIDISPSGDRVAIVDWVTEPQHVHSLGVFDLADGARRLAVTFPGHGGTTTGWWVDDTTIALTFLGDTGTQQEPIWGTVVLLDAATGQESDRWQGLTIRPQLVADGVFVGTPIADAVGVLAAAPVTGGEPLLVGSYEVDSLQGVHGLVPAPVTALAALPAFSGEALLAGIADAPMPAGEGGPAGPLLLAGVLVAGAAAAIALLAVRRRRVRSAEFRDEAVPSRPAPIEAPGETQVGRAGARSAEWLLWLAGVTGVLVWTIMAVALAGFAHGDYAPGAEPTLAERLVGGFLTALPVPLYLLAIAAAWGLGRGAAWSVSVGRLAAMLLLASLPLGALLMSAEVDVMIARQIVGLPVLLESPILLVVQAVAGAIALWGLRAARTVTFPQGDPGPVTAGIGLAGWITMAIGVAPALILLAGAVGLVAGGLDGDAVLDAVVFATAAVTFAVTGIGIGRGLRGRRRWSVPPVVPGVLLLSALLVLIAVAAGSSMLSEIGSTGEDGSPSSALLALAGGVVVMLPGGYVLVTVFRTRTQYVFR